jgi:hypothetical protein
VTAVPATTGQSPAARRADAEGRGSRLLRAHPADPAWARPALAALLAATALLYLAGLDRNGWGNEFYAAAVQAGTKSWKAFLFGSLDSSSFITTDKPAGSLWVMELSARVFGVNYWSLLVPQALAGVATAGVLYTTVRRWFGPLAYSLDTAATAHGGSSPSAGPAALSAFGDQPGGGLAGEADRPAAGDRTAARGGTGSDSAQITAWVESHFTAKTVGGSTVYDLTAPGTGSGS